MNWDKYRQQHNTIIKDYHDEVMSYNDMGYYWTIFTWNTKIPWNG